jgi:hypothetical protein
MLRAGSEEPRTSVDLLALAQDALSIFAPVLRTASVDASVTGSHGVVAESNRAFALQALLHVLENAILEAAVMTTHRWVEIIVRDDPKFAGGD